MVSELMFFWWLKAYKQRFKRRSPNRTPTKVVYQSIYAIDTTVKEFSRDAITINRDHATTETGLWDINVFVQGGLLPRACSKFLMNCETIAARELSYGWRSAIFVCYMRSRSLVLENNRYWEGKNYGNEGPSSGIKEAHRMYKTERNNWAAQFNLPYHVVVLSLDQ
jgi:hypothetical protein